MSEYIRIAVDAMGGDNAPSSVVEGTLEALKENDRIAVYLVGKEEAVKACLAGNIEDMEKYGILEVLEEDLALCEFVCPSKIDIQSIISDGIDLMLKEMA